MAFPLAHPAAVLPFRRWCPRVLSLPALVIGSLTPDFGYALAVWNLGGVSHRFFGIFVFCVPIGMALAVVLHRLRHWIVRLFPAGYRKALQPLCKVPLPTWRSLALSVMLGAMTHYVLDALTHRDGWIVERIACLNAPVIVVHGYLARVHHLLYHGTTFIGAFFLCVAAHKWADETLRSGKSPLPLKRWMVALVFAGLATLLSLHHHIVKTLLAEIATGTGMLLAVAGFVFCTSFEGGKEPAQP